MTRIAKPANSSQCLKQLGQYTSSPGHRGLAVMQNSSLSKQADYVVNHLLLIAFTNSCCGKSTTT